MMLVGVVPGPKEMSSIDSYMEIIADDVKNLNGLQVYDAFNKDTFTMKATVLLHVFDYPGQNKVLHSQGTLLEDCVMSCIHSNCMQI